MTSGNPRFSELLPETEIGRNGGLTKTLLTYINFANSKNVKRPVQEIIVSGPKNDLETIIESLSVNGVFAFKAISRLAKPTLSNLPMLQTSHGLSLKTLETQPSLNVLSFEFRMEVIRQRLTNAWQTILDILIVVTAIGFLGLYYTFRNTSERLVRLERSKTQQEQVLALSENQELIKQAEDLNKTTSRLMTLRQMVGGEEEILKSLSNAAPSGVTISSFLITRNPAGKGLADSSAWIVTGEALSRPLVLSFYNSLIMYPEFKEGKLYFASLEKDTGLTFRIATQHNGN
jgi:hypothetical protein